MPTDQDLHLPGGGDEWPLDPLVAFAELRPPAAPPTADELAAMRHAAFAVVPPPSTLSVRSSPVAVDADGAAEADPVRSDARPHPRAVGRRPRLAAAVALAAAMVAVLVVARRPERVQDRGPSATTVSPATQAPAPTTSTTKVGEVATVMPATSAGPPTVSAPTPLDASMPELPNDKLDPLNAFFLGTENGATVRQRVLAGQPDIASCMRERGWQYVEQTVLTSSGPAALLQARDPDGYRRRYGYGITTVDPSGTSGNLIWGNDPNAAYLETLTDDQMSAWTKDLNGSGDPSTNATSCNQIAYDAVAAAGGNGPTVDLGLAAVDPRYDVNKDARVIAANEAWIACMAAAGYPELRFPMDAQRVVIRRQHAVVRQAFAGWDSRSNLLPEVSAADRRALQQYELDLAELDHRCDISVGRSSALLAADTDIAAALRARFPDAVVEPYDQNMR